MAETAHTDSQQQPYMPQAGLSWAAQWAVVPEQWRTLRYRVYSEPFTQVFAANKRYKPDTEYDLAPPDSVPQRMRNEIAWWLWLSYTEGIRKLDPSLVRWLGYAVADTFAESLRRGASPSSITELSIDALLRHAFLGFERRNARLPSAHSRRDITHLVAQFHLYLSVRCTERHWWEHDVWDLRADPRIPRREHEPRHDMAINLTGIEPAWLKDGVRFWLRTALSTELLRWSSAVERARTMARHLGPFLTEHAISAPHISTDVSTLRSVFTDFSGYLRSPQASAKPGKTLSASAVDNTQSHTQVFYTFMVDHGPEAARETRNPNWLDLTDAHTRLWGPAYRTRAANRRRDVTWYSTTELQKMLRYLDVLAAPRGQRVTFADDDGAITDIAGLGDPQAARAWLLQALTGRRASEILMLDHDPLEAIPGQGRSAKDNDPDGFVAKLRYQQTKVDGVNPTIMVEQAVVSVIEEQRAYNAQHFPHLAPKYLFLGIRNQYLGQLPRPYASYRKALSQLDKIHGLVDSAGHPLRFTQTHRLRHTRATELLNDGVPIHVVQRYLGHASPEMTMRYAATLAATAEAEFLKHKKIGAHGTDIGISPSDVYDMTQLSTRTDRVLPNGVCLLPPLKTCDKGNACLSCGHFATDATHLGELDDQRHRTANLVAARKQRYFERHGRELTDDNVWVANRQREIASLDAIIDRLRSEEDTDTTVGGAGTNNRLPQLHITTKGSHESALRKANDRPEEHP